MSMEAQLGRKAVAMAKQTLVRGRNISVKVSQSRLLSKKVAPEALIPACVLGGNSYLFRVGSCSERLKTAEGALFPMPNLSLQACLSALAWHPFLGRRITVFPHPTNRGVFFGLSEKIRGFQSLVLRTK